jgi:uncharacterized protein YdaU (DUF1376 family)
MNYYKRHIGDYHKKAGRLSMLEHGAYTLLLDACYDREKFPTRDEAIDWCWARSTEEIAAVEFVLSKFFTLEGGVHVQSTISENITQYHENALKNKQIAIEREEARRLKREQAVHDQARTVHESPPNHKPLTNNHKPLLKEKDIVDSGESPEKASKKKKPKPSAFDDLEMTYQERAFNVFWSEVERKKVGKADALKAFIELTKDCDEEKTDFALNVVCHWYDLYLQEDESRLLPENKKYLKGAGAWMREKPWQADKAALMEYKKQYYGVEHEC